MHNLKGEQLTAEQKKELDALENHSIVFDEDCPELTPEQLKQMAIIAKEQRTKRRL